MKNLSSSEIRDAFLDFFRSKQHEIVPSAPVYLPADKTLMFVNAGMVPFKDIFLGARESADTRVADSQKCIRVSGKHNDLEDVGRDTYHHTFFEMLGNWSFGDYYKEEAISWAWEFLTGVLGLPKERLYATIYKDDDEAEDLWKRLTDIDPSHIQRHDEKDNFWEMGETGPCGPCSEIHVDLTEDLSGASLVNADSPEVIEIWNLVFIQYNRRADRSLEELPSKHVDTGMGFERLVAVLQGKKSNYDTDIFKPIIDKICALSGRSYEGEDAVAMRVIADHLRMVSFSIADGVIPSNEGRNYIVRMLIRRAVRFGRKLDFEDPFMGEIFPVLEQVMGAQYPELGAQRENILMHLRNEELKFGKTLERGMVLFNELVEGLKAEGETVIRGADSFKLYGTYGFPFELTQLMAEEVGMSADQDDFNRVKEAEKEVAGPGNAGEADLVADLIAEGIKSEFTGYDHTQGQAKILKLVKDGVPVAQLAAGELGGVILDATPFYAESGGQVGDTGVLTGTSARAQVTDTQKPAMGLFLHQVTVEEGTLSVGDEVSAEIDADRRLELERNHSGTHLLNGALRDHINDSIRQKGSYVGPDRMRFDFSYPEALSPEQLDRLERQVNTWIMGAEEVRTYEMPMKEVASSDIIAVFDEKYGDVVRVVDIGGYSKELCGGTHVKHVGELGAFRIVGESSVQAGVRRIEAVTGTAATEKTLHEHQLVRELSRSLSASPDELMDRVKALVKNNREMEKALKKQAAEAALSNVDGLLDQQKDLGGMAVLAAVVDDQPVDGLRNIMDGLRRKMPSGVIVLGSNTGGKAALVASVSDDLVGQGVHAGNLVKALAKICGGGGGGAPNKAQAGGKDGSKVGEAIAAAEGELAGMRGQ